MAGELISSMDEDLSPLSLSKIGDGDKVEAIRESIMAFEEDLRSNPEAFIGDSELCPLKHSFSPGIYVREIFIPANTMLTGKIHKHEHPNFLMSGTVEVVTEQGRELLTGPLAMISPPGTKRALHAITDLVWITVHHNPTNTQDLKKLEKIIIAPSYSEYNKHISSKKSFFNKLLNIFNL